MRIATANCLLHAWSDVGHMLRDVTVLNEQPRQRRRELRVDEETHG